MLDTKEQDALITDTIKVVDWDKAEPYTTGWTPLHLGEVVNGNKPRKTLCGVWMRGKIRVADNITDGLCSRCIKSAVKRKKKREPKWVTIAMQNAAKEGYFIGKCECRAYARTDRRVVSVLGEDDCPVHGFGDSEPDDE